MENIKEKSKKSIVISGVSAGIAIFVAAIWGYLLSLDIDYISFIIIWDAIGHVSVFDMVDYLSILNLVLIKPLVVIITMILFAIYGFFFFKKNRSFLYVVSTMLLTIWGILLLMMNGIIILMDTILRMEFSLFSISYIFTTISGFFITLSFFLMTLQYFNKIKFNIRYIPVIAIIFFILISTFFAVMDGYFSFDLLKYMGLDISYLIPFALLLLFCPIKKIKSI